MSLKCALTSDLHYGYSPNTSIILEKFLKKLAEENIDVLFLAGDLASSKQEELDKCLRLIRKYLPTQTIFFTEGNHDWWSGKPQQMPWDTNRYAPINYGYVYAERRRLPFYKRPMSFAEMQSYHKNVFKDHQVIHLDGTSHELTPNTIVMGFPGWYHETNLQTLGTNDYRYMPEMIESAPMHVYLNNKAYKDLDTLLNIPTEDKTVVMMTHFPPFTESEMYLKYCANPRYLEPITQKSDYLLVGHSHRQADFMENGCRILNAGINEQIHPVDRRYDKPNYLIFTLD